MRRQFQRENTSSAIAFRHRQIAAHATGEGACDAEAQTISSNGTGGGIAGPPEAVEHVPPLFCGQARPSIGHSYGS
jgi:hypothetical protein